MYVHACISLLIAILVNKLHFTEPTLTISEALHVLIHAPEVSEVYSVHIIMDKSLRSYVLNYGGSSYGLDEYIQLCMYSLNLYVFIEPIIASTIFCILLTALFNG